MGFGIYSLYSTCTTALGVTAVIALLPAVLLHAEDSPPGRLERIDNWRSTLPDTIVEARFRVNGDDQAPVRLEWRLTSRHRTISNGNEVVRLTDEKSNELKVPIAIPRLAKGVSLDAKLEAWLEDANGELVGERLVRPVWILAADPFSKIRQSADNSIVLYDPQTTTVKQFEKSGIPYHRLRTIDALLETNASLVIIGENTSFSRNRALADALRTLLAGGKRILVLAPAEGRIFDAEFDASNSNSGSPVSMRAVRRQLVTEFDRRLDSSDWVGTEVPPGRLAIDSGNQRLSINVVDKGVHWSEIELQATAPHGQVRICDMPVIRHWESGPSPRYLLKHWMTMLNPTDHNFQSEE